MLTPLSPRLTIRLSSGRQINIGTVTLGYTYAGMLEGGPSDALHARLIARVGKIGRARFGQSEHAVIPPRLEARVSGDRAMYLPPIAVVALFVSDEPARDRRMEGSSLVIGWFQASFEPIVALEARTLIEELDWDALARDWDL